MNDSSSAPQSAFCRICIAVPGMHRSGTSAIAGTLGLLGCELPKHLNSVDEGNEKGYFEPAKIININDELLASSGLVYHDWDDFPSDWGKSLRAAEFRRRMSMLIGEEYNSSLFVLKDPRICRLLPTLIGALQDLEVEPRFILPYRRPLEVALSINLRGGFPIEQGFLLWIRYLLEAENGSRGFKRAFVSYSSFLANWRCEISRLESQVDLGFPRKTNSAQKAVDTFLEPHLKHFDREVDWSSAGGLLPWLMGIERAYDRLIDRPYDAAVLDELDQIRAEFGSCSKFFYSTIRNAFTRLEKKRHRANGLDAELQAAKEARSEADRASAAQIDELTQQTRRLEKDLAAAAAEADELRNELSNTRQEANLLQDALHCAGLAHQELSVQLASSQRRREQMRRSFSWRVTRPVRTVRTITKRAMKIIGRPKRS